ncbi:MAG: polysaccharide biosynthesis protein [Candidatus Margulisbacteria bacterium]|nr:polysaccharide biosynthesis protein [Candidatus Margulisiibacteriota bacterium]
MKHLTNSKIFLILFDALIINFSIFLAFLIRFDGFVPVNYLIRYLQLSLPITVVSIYIFLRFGLYRQVWTYASIDALLSIFFAVSIASTFGFAVTFVLGVGRYPYSVSVVAWLLDLLLIGGSRFMWRISREKIFPMVMEQKDIERKKVLIIGAGDAGESILREMLRVRNGYYPVGLIDDNPKKVGLSIHGIKVLGGTEDIPELIKGNKIDEAIIAIPAASGKERRRIVSVCRQAKLKYKTLPPIYELIDGNVSVNNIREVKEEDLLGRKPIKFEFNELRKGLEGKTILVTGAGGSIGSELCRQISKCSPKQLIMVGQGENSIFHIDLELRENIFADKLVPVIANVQDKARVDQILDKYCPQIIFHAAAYKHVGLMEKHPEEAYKNNVQGTKNIAESALIHGVERFVLISTDKAVSPTSVMGKSKQEAETIVLGLHGKGKTKFMVTRFGNVINSRGSVIPLFKRQIAQGKEVTVTHPNVVRFFMTIPEAVQLVILAGLMGQGGEIFVLDMGEPIKIADLAKDLITLSGLEPGKDISVKYVGLRPGEKLSEELISPDEEIFETAHKSILMVKKKV